MAGKTYKSWNPEQTFLLPPSPLDWLPEGHLAHFVLDVVEQLDLSEIDAVYQAKDARGTRPYHPAMMTSLLLYGYCVGVFSSRKLERATYEDVAFRVLSGGNHPDHTRIATFRRVHLDALKGLFLQVLKLCRSAGMVKLGHVAIDGTKLQGNASKHKAMSYKRMLQSERQLTEEVEQLLKQAEQTDASDDARFGSGFTEEDLPAELRRREGRLARIREAKARLEAEAAEARARSLRAQADRAEKLSKRDGLSEKEQKRARTCAKNKAAKARKLAPERDDDDLDPPTSAGGLPLHEPRVKTNGTPHDAAQMNFTDGDSRIVESGGGFVQGYNCQAAVDAAHQIIVAQDVSNQSPDNGNLVPMVKQVLANCDAAPKTATADAGYWHADAPDECSVLGTNVYISTKRRKHWNADDTVTEGPPRDDLGARDQMQHKVSTKEGRAIYARRKAVVEPVFGQIKECRGFRRFHLRGLPGATGEWALACTCHNLLKLFRFRIEGPATA